MKVSKKSFKIVLHINLLTFLPSSISHGTNQNLKKRNIKIEIIPMHTTTKIKAKKLMSRPTQLPQFSSATPRMHRRRTKLLLSPPPTSSLPPKETINRSVHHLHVRTQTTRKKRPFLNKHTISSTRFIAFAIATIMTSSNLSPSSLTTMANAFVPAPMETKKTTRVVQMNPSLIQEASVLSEFDTMDKILDMSLSVATTAEASSTASDFSLEEFQYSLRKKLKVPETPYNPTAEDLWNNFPKVCGHRGCLYDELENTIEGFSRCHDIGCDSVELDVFRVKRSSKNDDDTTLVVFHGGGTDENPGDLLDYCGVDGSILDFNYEDEISKKLLFNPEYAEFPCHIEKIRNGKIPTLEEVLINAKHKNSSKPKHHKQMEIKIELKGPDVVEDVLALVDSLGVASMCSYSSFDLQKLKQVRDLKSDRDPFTGEYLYKTSALFNNIDADGMILDDDYSPIQSVPNWSECNVIDRALSVGASAIHLKYDTCNKPLVDRIHASGLGSMAWFRGPIGMGEDCCSKYRDVGNEDFAMYEAVLQTGVKELCVNKPDVLVTLREKIVLQQKLRTMEGLENLVISR